MGIWTALFVVALTLLLKLFQHSIGHGQEQNCQQKERNCKHFSLFVLLIFVNFAIFSNMEASIMDTLHKNGEICITSDEVTDVVNLHVQNEQLLKELQKIHHQNEELVVDLTKKFEH